MAGPPQAERDIVAEVGRGEIAAVYWLCGKERFLVERALDAIRDGALDPKTRGFNLDVVECKAKSHCAEKIIALARTLPMMARRRLVLCKDADLLDPDDLEALDKYVREPSPSTCVVFVAEGADLRRRFFMTLKKLGALAKFEPLYERRLPGWVEAEAKSRGTRIEREAAELLVEVIGADLAQLAGALEQLALYSGADRKQPITVAHVEAVVAETRLHSVFDLANAVGEKDPRKALHQCGRMLAAKEPAVRILYMLTRHFRQLWTARELAGRRASNDDIAQALGIRPFFVEGILGQARRFSAAGLRRCFEALYVADRQLKGSRLGDELILERLVLELIGSGGRGAK